MKDDYRPEDDASDVATRLAKSISEFVNLLCLIVAPQLQSKWFGTSEPPRVREELLETLDGFERDWATHGERVTGPASFAEFLALVPAMRNELEQWMAETPPASAVNMAREALRTLHVPDPPGGWYAFSGDWDYLDRQA